MDDLSKRVSAHYYRPELYEQILEKLRISGISLSEVTREHLARVDEFHVRGAEVSRELALESGLKGATVLDVGCGLGGPCRMLAEVFECQVTGLDLSEEFIHTAEKLSVLVGLEDRTRFVQGNALDLPFKEASFEVVWTQHVQMNVREKSKFYGEIARVLAPGGTFLYYDILKKRDHTPAYPMPWAETPATSFLITQEELSGLLDQLGMRVIQIKDQTQAGIGFFEAMFERIKADGPPALSLGVLMGDSTATKLGNLLAALKAGQLQLESGILKKSD